MVRNALSLQNLHIRPATMDDLQVILELISTQDIEDYGEPLWSEADLRSSWQAPDIHLETDTWVVVTPEDHPVSYAYLRVIGQVRMFSYVYVLPVYRGRGIGTHLRSLAEGRARECMRKTPLGTRVTLGGRVSDRNMAAQRILKQAGYTKIRSYASMEIEIDTPPQNPRWAEDIQIRPFRANQDERAIYQADEEVSNDERGHVPLTFEEWKSEYPNVNSTYTFLACHGDETAGFVINETLMGVGWVDHLGVRHPWRGKGLGMALLLHSFGEFYRHGIRKVRLNVDAHSLTGANRLYERAGMCVTQQYHIYEMELRPGKDRRTRPDG